jgi:transaldolase
LTFKGISCTVIERFGHGQSPLKIFLDTASIQELRQAISTGFVEGVTTNPSLLARQKSDKTVEGLLLEICKLQSGPVSLEVDEDREEIMLAQARWFRQLASNIVIKVPLTPEGLNVCRILRSEGTEVNVTLCFSCAQGFLAAKAGATFVSPFIGRLEDSGGCGIELLRDLRSMMDHYGFSTQILAASIRNPRHVAEALQAGADVATMPFSVLFQLYAHPLTQQGLMLFRQDSQTKAPFVSS